jgi:hypothetical protein
MTNSTPSEPEPPCQRGIPDDVAFAQRAGSGDILFGDLRKNPDAAVRAEFLARRLETFFLCAYEELLERNVSSPFSVSIMVMSGIGTLGEIFYSNPPADSRDKNRETFRRFCARVDQRFARPHSVAFRKAFAQRWSTERPDSISGVLYTYFRNSLIHGYHGQGVFLTGQSTQEMLVKDDGTVLIHPRWLLEKFIAATKAQIEELRESPPDSGIRGNALEYLNRLLA